MKRRKKKLNHWTAFDTVILIISIAAIVVTAYPMIYVASCSISDPLMVMSGKVRLLPVGFSSKAYELVVSNTEFWRCMANSVFYVVVGCALVLFNTVLVAYPLTRPNLKGRKFLNYFLLVPMYFHGGMIPTFIIVTKLGLYNSMWSLILPTCYTIWYMFLCRTFMSSLPGELVDSALIDGCDQYRTLTKIILPLSKPVLAVVMIYTIVGIWNSWFNASIYTTNKDIQPVQLYLKNILASATSSTSGMMSGMPEELQVKFQEIRMAGNQIKYALIVITTLPIIFVYPMFQKHFTKGIIVGSLKG